MTALRTWIPNQHGAWAMLTAPVLVGALASGINGWHALLITAWLAAFCLNFYISLTIKSRKRQRYLSQIGVYFAAVAGAGLPLVWHQPSLLYLLAVAIPAFALNMFLVSRRNERAWINDIAGVALAGFVGYGAYLLGADPRENAHAARSLLAVCLYFAGTVIYVKTLIRERGNRTWLRLSYGFHALLLTVCLLSSWWVAAGVATALLARASAVPTRRWSPKRVGFTEIGFTMAVAATALFALP